MGVGARLGAGLDPARREAQLAELRAEQLARGLGLSLVHGFARQSGGRVVIDSRPGRGCAVRLELPLAAV